MREFSTRLIENAFKKCNGLTETNSGRIVYLENINTKDDPYLSADMFSFDKTPDEIVLSYKQLVDTGNLYKIH